MMCFPQDIPLVAIQIQAFSLQLANEIDKLTKGKKKKKTFQFFRKQIKNPRKQTLITDENHGNHQETRRSQTGEPGLNGGKQRNAITKWG